MIEREVAEKIVQYAAQYPVVTITGPRQSGKTTLCRMLFPDRAYVNLESIDERGFAERDPKGFLARFPDGAIIDEIQRGPDLLSYIQVEVDEIRQAGRYIITGSQNFELLNTVSQSLAGRTALVRLLPLSVAEVRKTGKIASLDQLLYRGGYPRIYDQDLNPTEALAFYVGTYVERDLRMLINIKDLSRFEVFLKLCAGRTGQILNLSSLGNDCGVNHNTVKSWLSILEASFLIKLLPPYYRNFNKRVIKSPKLYFLDTGLACFLLGIQSEEQLPTHPLRGALFETFVVSELLKSRFNRGKTDNLYYFRDNKGNEVDLVLDQGIAQRIVEIKAGQTINSSFFKGLHYFTKLSGEVEKSFLVYGGKETRTQEGIEVTGWERVDSVGVG
ncbi:ATP-binding protein [Desulfurivibrio dismutans]|uniref:ATP-binding protein n=1 Tax=Desulfurivibrio dismutans TaxID=1398908 RepID=UPI0023DC6867|nr:ATP-binding protein [Desulfurivibrio alkaliphilus]MDF1615669.1 ATP-binding protein [Desulfurivibrio alkaliphilus]